MKFKWTRTEQYAFYKIKRVVACDNLLNYPDFNEELKIIINASDIQLGAVISQKGKPIAFYIIKLTEYQRRYTVTERGMLSIVETIKYFGTILFGKILKLYTDNKKPYM